MRSTGLALLACLICTSAAADDMQRGVDLPLYGFDPSPANMTGLAASLAVLWLGMRAVMGVGGFCAEGGPYVIAHHCPEGTAWLIPLAVFAGLGSAGLTAWKGASLGAPWSGLIGLAWASARRRRNT